MKSKCPMYVWDGFSGHRKACGNVIYTVYVHVHTCTQKVIIFGNSFLLVFVTHRLIYCLFSSITEVLFNEFVFQY